MYTLGWYQEVVERCSGLVVDWTPGGPECLVALAELRMGNDARAAEIVPRFVEAGAPVLEGFVRAAAGREQEAFALFDRTVKWDYWPSIAFLSVSLRRMPSGTLCQAANLYSALYSRNSFAPDLVTSR